VMKEFDVAGRCCFQKTVQHFKTIWKAATIIQHLGVTI